MLLVMYYYLREVSTKCYGRAPLLAQGSSLDLMKRCLQDEKAELAKDGEGSSRKREFYSRSVAVKSTGWV